MAINVADVVTEYGNYYLDHGQGTQDLFTKLHRPSVTASYFQSRPTKETVMRFGASSITRVLQPFQKAFTPIGDIIFKPNRIDLYNLKIDKVEYPDDIVDNWLGFLEGEGIDRTQWPFVKWMLEELVIPEAKENFEQNEAFLGVYAAPTPGTAGAAGTAMNGIKKQQDLYITAGLTNVLTMGAVPTADIDVCNYIELFVETIGDRYRKSIDYVFVSESIELKYRRGKRAKYNTNYMQDPNTDTVSDFPNAKVIGLPSQSGSGRIWATIPGNRVRGIKKSSDLRNFMVKEFSPRAVSLYTDWWEVLGFKYPQALFVNDVALPV